jgi:hypothetical protein
LLLLAIEPLTLAEKYFVCVFLNGEKTVRRVGLAQDELPKEIFYSPDRWGKDHVHKKRVSLPSMCMDELSIGEIIRVLFAWHARKHPYYCNAIAKRHGRMNRSLLGLIKRENAGKVNKTIVKETSCQLGWMCAVNKRIMMPPFSPSN